MSSIRVFGIGSSFGDDQIGWETINLLKKQEVIKNISSDTLSLSCCNHPQELLDLMRGAEVVFLIDAIKSNNQVGTIHRLENEEIYAVDHQLSTHGLGLAHILQLGKVLNDLPKRVILYGIEIGNTEGFSISDELLKTAKSKLVDEIVKELLVVVKSIMNWKPKE